MLSIIMESTFSEFLNPKPHAFTSGATVISNAPSVVRLISVAFFTISLNRESIVSERLVLMADMTELSLKVDKELSISRNVDSIPARNSVG